MSHGRPQGVADWKAWQWQMAAERIYKLRSFHAWFPPIFKLKSLHAWFPPILLAKNLQYLSKSNVLVLHSNIFLMKPCEPAISERNSWLSNTFDWLKHVETSFFLWEPHGQSPTIQICAPSTSVRPACLRGCSTLARCCWGIWGYLGSENKQFPFCWYSVWDFRMGFRVLGPGPGYLMFPLVLLAMFSIETSLEKATFMFKSRRTPNHQWCFCWMGRGKNGFEVSKNSKELHCHVDVLGTQNIPVCWCFHVAGHPQYWETAGFPLHPKWQWKVPCLGSKDLCMDDFPIWLCLKMGQTLNYQKILQKAEKKTKGPLAANHWWSSKRSS